MFSQRVIKASVGQWRVASWKFAFGIFHMTSLAPNVSPESSNWTIFPPSPNTFVEIEKSSWIIKLKPNMHELHKFVYYSCCRLSGRHSMLTALRWRFFVSIRSSNFPSLHRKLHRNHPISSMLLNDLHRRLHSSCLLDRLASHSDAWTLE